MADRNPLQEQTYHRLKMEIIHGVIEPGQRLSEPELAAMFQVSRSPIREAVMRLERDGFLIRGPSGRLSVAPLDVEEMRHLYVLRASLEGLATRLATPRLRTLDLEEMAEALAANWRAVEDRDGDQGALAGQAFHEVILRECGNGPLREVLFELSSRINRFRMLAVSFDRYDAARLKEHQRILDALYERQAEAAEAAMIVHIENSGTVLLGNIRRALAKKEADAAVA
jgi:DNA-binding GntR family transcriptional regulator